MKLSLGGKEYEFKYNNSTLFEIEKQLDKPLLSIIGDEGEMSKLNTMAVIAYCGISSEKEPFDEFINSFHLKEIVAIAPDLGKLISDSFNTGEEVVKKKKVKAK
jgi:hypothetical protein